MKLFNFLKKEDTNKKLKLQYLANLFLVAKSDGIVSKEEENKIDEIRKSIGITKDEYEKLTKSILSGNFGSKNFVSPKSDEEAWNQLIECVNLITIDGKIDNAEIQTCKDLAKAMGYNESDIDELLPKEVLKSFNDSKKIKFNNQTLRTAIEDWLEYPISAEATYGHISGWDTSKVNDMSKLFLDAHTFNEPLNNWDVSNVTNMHAMFDNAYAFNQPLNNWEVGNVTDMSEMFSSMEALAFNQPIGNWDVSNVTNMYSMFSEAKEFNQPIGDWDVSNVMDMQGMFFGAKAFNQPIGNWDLNSVTDMKGMFYGATAFNQPIGNLDVSNVINMSMMFNDAEAFNQPIGNWDVSGVTDMSGMFYGAKAFNQPLGNWNVKNVTDMKGIFKDENTFNQPIENWNLTFQANIDMGDIKRIQKEYQAATTYYTKAIEIEPKNALGYKKRGNVKEFTKNFKGAVADLTTAIELNPNNVHSYELRGLYKEDLKDFEGAILDYKKAIELEHDTEKIKRYNAYIETATLRMEGKDEKEILRAELIKRGIDPDAEIDLKGIAALLSLNEKAMNATNEQLTDIERIELHNNLKDRKTDETINLIEEDAKGQIHEKEVDQDYCIRGVNVFISHLKKYLPDVDHFKLAFIRLEESFTENNDETNEYTIISYYLHMYIGYNEKVYLDANDYSLNQDCCPIPIFAFLVSNKDNIIKPTKEISNLCYKELQRNESYFFDEFEKLFNEDIKKYGNDLKPVIDEGINSFDKTLKNLSSIKDAQNLYMSKKLFDFEKISNGYMYETLFDFEKILNRFKEYQRN